MISTNYKEDVLNSKTDDIIESIFLKYNLNVKDYKYIPYKSTIEIPEDSYIMYISKKSFIKKTGILKSVKDISIIELRSKNKKIVWYIYTDKHYIFLKTSTRDKFKDALRDLVNSDFKIIKKN